MYLYHSIKIPINSRTAQSSCSHFFTTKPGTHERVSSSQRSVTKQVYHPHCGASWKYWRKLVGILRHCCSQKLEPRVQSSDERTCHPLGTDPRRGDPPPSKTEGGGGFMMPCKPVYIAHSQPASGIIARNPEKKEPKTPKLYKHIVVVFQYPSTPPHPKKQKKTRHRWFPASSSQLSFSLKGKTPPRLPIFLHLKGLHLFMPTWELIILLKLEA